MSSGLWPSYALDSLSPACRTFQENDAFLSQRTCMAKMFAAARISRI